MKCENGQWVSRKQECDQQRLLRVSRRGPDVPLPAHAHLSALRLPLNGTLALDHLLFLHAWVALGSDGEKKNANQLSPLFSLALWCFKCDCPWIVAAFPWRFWHEKQAGLSGLSHGQWSRTKTINLLTLGYYYQGEWGTSHRGFLSHEIHVLSNLQTHLRCVDWIIPIHGPTNRFWVFLFTHLIQMSIQATRVQCRCVCIELDKNDPIFVMD